MDYEKVTNRTIEKLQALCGETPPVIAVVLGSGLGGIVEELEEMRDLPFGDIEGFPKSTVSGHRGRFVVGVWKGVKVLMLQGRLHAYEGYSPQAFTVWVRAVKAVGVKGLFLTNAAGSLDLKMPPGSLMGLSDHINYTGISPLAGPNDEKWGPRFFDMGNAYDREMRNILNAKANEIGVTLHEGVYVWYLGPNFETYAEIRLFQNFGAQAVGMSTVPEVLVARHCGLRVVAVSSITNYAAGLMDTVLSHEETLSQGEMIAQKLKGLLGAALPLLMAELDKEG